MSKLFEVNYAGFPIKYQFRKNGTARYFSNHIHISNSVTYDIRMNDQEFESFRGIHPNDVSDEYVEYKGLIYLSSRKLLCDQRCIFHAVSFFWKNKAWLLTGKSGIGKTTQYMNWNRIYPNEIRMISGDMPLLEFKYNKIIVHPSPWNGKENLRGIDSAELGGIFILRQDNDNKIINAEKKNGIISLFRQFAVIPQKEEEIYALANMVQRMNEDIPIYFFSNDGSENSTRLLRQTILNNLEKE